MHTTKKAIRTIDDVKGMRLRFSTPAIREFIAAMGATPVGVPPTEVAEQLQKGTLDGAFTDYGGAGIAWKLGGICKYTTEMYCFVSSFAVVANEAWFAKLPPDLQKMVTESVTGIEKDIGTGWDALDVPGKKAMMDGGGEAIRLAQGRRRQAAPHRRRRHRIDLQGDGGQGHAGARGLRHDENRWPQKHAKTSKSFWA